MNGFATAPNENRQCFLFDFVLKSTERLDKPISEETVAVTLEQRDQSPYRVPKLDEIIKRIEKTSYSVDRRKFVSDVFECGAIALSNTVDFTQYEPRETRYKEMIAGYRPQEQKAASEIFGMIFALLSSMTYSNGGFRDYLGELFMGLNLGNSASSQFFTPYHVSKMCAKMTLDDTIVSEKQRNGEILTFYEPCCGSGGMVLAIIDVLYNDYKFNYAHNCFVVCEDIDIRCVHMAYLQLSLAGVPAIVKHQNALSRELWSVWKTPAYIFQYSHFRHLENQLQGGDKR